MSQGQDDAFVRTTIDLPDDLYRSAKTAAVRRKVSLKLLVRQAVEEHLASPGAGDAPPAWMKHIGGLDPETADGLRRNLEEAEFSRVDPADTASASRGAGARAGGAA